MERIQEREPYVYQITGYKNTGKTSLVCRLVALWSIQGLPAATIKHDAHHFQIDRSGSDTWKHQQAGACWTAITSRLQTAILQKEATELEQLAAMAPADAIVLVEGFKHAAYPKLFMARTEEDLKLLGELDNLDAVVLWPELDAERVAKETASGIRLFGRDETAKIAGHILERIGYAGRGGVRNCEAAEADAAMAVRATAGR
ncbi:molybdopterin-guanine dinucleotide biosynthesis protein B [Paenibacillus thailandensis]|uniref:Molybdopterin-guanine dinucleotide biosynthesis protein B n=1 Tax=Paenibacillus thailandensis TaxID=393250 RepID=A0ABW5R0X8_9BACL